MEKATDYKKEFWEGMARIEKSFERKEWERSRKEAGERFEKFSEIFDINLYTYVHSIVMVFSIYEHPAYGGIFS